MSGKTKLTTKTTGGDMRKIVVLDGDGSGYGYGSGDGAPFILKEGDR